MANMTVKELAALSGKSDVKVRAALKAAGVGPIPGETQKAASADGRGRPASLYPVCEAKIAVGIE